MPPKNVDATNGESPEKVDNSVKLNDDVEKSAKEELKDVAPTPEKVEAQGKELEAPAIVAKDSKKEAADKTEQLDSEAKTDVTPPLPARKRTEVTEALPTPPSENPILTQLKEAFPNLEEKYVKAVIIASEGALDPAFNALLFLSDPESGADIELPSQPIVQKAPDLPQRRKMSQLEQDEALARQLDDEFNKNRHQQRDRNGRRQMSAEEREARRERIRERHRRNQQPLSAAEKRELYGDDEDSWAQFMEKELPELREKANRSIQETATKLNGWISGFKKNIYGEYAEQNDRRDNFDDTDFNSQRETESSQNYAPKKPERRRFNSFGAQVGEESLEQHGITLQNDDIDDELEEEDDVPPQIKSAHSAAAPGSNEEKPKDGKVVAQTTYIDTPDASTRKKWQPVPPEPLNATPTKVVATPNKKEGRKSADEDEFLINSEDEMQI